MLAGRGCDAGARPLTFVLLDDEVSARRRVVGGGVATLGLGCWSKKDVCRVDIRMRRV